MILRYLLTSFIIFLLSFSSSFAVADVIAPTGILPKIGENPGDTIASLISFLISFTAVLAVLAVTWGSMQMILAAGEDEKVKKARMIIIYAFVGLLVAGLAYAIVFAITRLQLG